MKSLGRLYIGLGLICLLSACGGGGGGSGGASPATMTAIQSQLTTWQSKFASSVPSASDPVLLGLLDTNFLHDGSTKAVYLVTICAPGGFPLGATFSAPVAITPLDVGAAPNDATHQWFTTQLEGSPLTMLAVLNASGVWLFKGDQRNVGVNVVPYAQLTNSMNPASSVISSGVTLGLKLNYVPTGSPDIQLSGLAGVASATVSGPGLTAASAVTIFTASASQTVPECNALITTNCLNRSALPGTYTFNIFGAAVSGVPSFTYTYKEKVGAQLPAALSLSSLNFPVINAVTAGIYTPPPAAQLTPSVPVTVTWTLPTTPVNQAAQYVSMSGWNGVGPTATPVFYLNLSPSSSAGTSLNNLATLPAVLTAVTNYSVRAVSVDSTGMNYATVNNY